MHTETVFIPSRELTYHERGPTMSEAELCRHSLDHDVAINNLHSLNVFCMHNILALM